MIPGPTPVPERVLEALGRHPIGHRSKDFQNVVKSTTDNLQWLHQTKNEILTITGSGTAAMEAGIINTLSKGDKVVCGENGKFGQRWVKVAEEFGLEVIQINAEWGQPLDPEKFKYILENDINKDIKAVILTHSETSTGVINDLETSSRGIYAGCVGYFSGNGDMETCIVLRTALIKNKIMYVQAGAGIVADSNPQKEYEETINKAKALFKAAETAHEYE